MGCSGFSTLSEEIIPFKIQLILKIDKINSFESIISIHKLRKNKIGILFENLLLIYSSKNFSKINNIKMDRNEILTFLDKEKVKYYSDYEYIVEDFIEMKNSDLILCTPIFVYFYTLYGKEYKLFQIIKGYLQNNSLYELSNGNLVSCSSYGINIYYKDKEKNKYILLSKHEIKLGVQNIIELKLNEFILLKRYHKRALCSHDSSFNDYSISIYNIENKNEKDITSLHVSGHEFFGNSEMNYLIKNEYLFVKYAYKIDIYDIKKNMKLINHNNKMFERKKVKINRFFTERIIEIKELKKEFNIDFLCNFDDFIFVKDIDNIIKIYTFRNNSLKFYQNLPFQNKNIKGIVNLKNNNLLIYTSEEIFIFKHL